MLVSVAYVWRYLVCDRILPSTLKIGSASMSAIEPLFVSVGRIGNNLRADSFRHYEMETNRVVR